MSDYFNSFANPQGGGGQDIPQPGTPAWFQWLQSIVGQGPMPGQIPGQPMGATTTPTAGGGVQPPPGPLAPVDASQRPGAFAGADPAAYPSVMGPGRGMSSATAATIPVTGLPPMPNARVVAGRSPNAIAPVAPPQSPPVAAANVKQQQPQQKPPPAKRPAPAAAAATDDSMLYPFKAIGGAPSATGNDQGTPNLGGGVTQPALNPAPATTDATPDASINAHIAMGSGAYGVPGAPSNGAVPNLGYYRPTMGNAQGNPTWVPQGATGSPQMFRGPLALPGSQNYYGQPAAAGAAAPAPAPAAAAAATAPAGTPGPIAPGVGTQWLRKLFGGGGQATT